MLARELWSGRVHPRFENRETWGTRPNLILENVHLSRGSWIGGGYGSQSVLLSKSCARERVGHGVGPVVRDGKAGSSSLCSSE